jgi:SWI/SNF-related matrix-associated actin-dependent regulator 1 of chromatin subfamily A
VFCLSGTPITDYPAKFYTVLNLIKPEVFYNKKKFLWHFCDPKNNGFGWSYKGHTHSDELHRLIQPFMIRRKKSDILSELPDKTRQIISVPINRTKYDKQLAEFDTEDKNHKTPFMRKKSLLDDILYDEKKPMVMSFIEDMLDSEKVIVYTLYRRTIDDVLEYFGDRAVKIDGSIPVDKRRGIIQGFVNNDKTRVLCANIQAVGTGVDGLQDAASHGVFINFPWESASCYQAEDRLHRIGQNNPVNVYYMVAENTIEHELIKLIDQKDKIVKEVIDGESDSVSEFLETFRG